MLVRCDDKSERGTVQDSPIHYVAGKPSRMSVWVPILVALIGAIPATLAFWLAWDLRKQANSIKVQGEIYHKLVNSRLDQLLVARGSRSRAAGRLQGLAEARRKDKKDK